MSVNNSIQSGILEGEPEYTGDGIRFSLLQRQTDLERQNRVFVKLRGKACEKIKDYAVGDHLCVEGPIRCVDQSLLRFVDAWQIEKL